MQRSITLGALAIMCMAVASCSWFGKDDEAKPAELKPIKQEVKLDRAWYRSVGGEARDRASKLVPVVAGGRVFAASADGIIMAIKPDDGKVIWRKDVRDYYDKSMRPMAFADKSDLITGGVGAGRDIIVIGTFGGDVIAINQSDGSLAWRSRATSEILAPPQVAGDRVVAQTIDGKVAAYNALDGTRQWVYSTSIPSLTLRGTSTPIVNGNMVIAGFANGRVAFIDLDKGIAGNDQRVAIAKGKSDLERLVDIDGQMVLDGTTLYVASYQGNIIAIDVSNGRVEWNKEASTVTGLAEGFGNIYMSGADGTLSAMAARDGDVRWKTEDLANRQLSTPAVISSYVAVGDFDGYIHLLAQSDGRFVGRVHADGDAIKSPMVVNGTRMYVQTRGGTLLAYDLR